MTSARDEEGVGPFGKAALAVLSALFPNMYQTVLIVDPTFSEFGRANIKPQFESGQFFVLSSVEEPKSSGHFTSSLKLFSCSQDLDDLLDCYRYEHAILASPDLSVLTAWAQAEYALIAFRGACLGENKQWLHAMRSMGVIHELR